MIRKSGYVYILASRRNGTFYTGVTSDLLRRVWQHKHEEVEGFSKRYGVHMLVYFEVHPAMMEAIKRETLIKGWNRAWKLEMIEKHHSDWHDLYPSLDRNPGFPLSRE